MARGRWAQVARWRRAASRAEIVGAVLVALSVLGLLAVSFVPAGELPGRLATGAPGGSAPGTVGAAATGAGAAGEPTVAGSVAGAATASTGTAAGAGVPGATAGGAGAPLGATDQGVTSDTIKVGFLLANVGGLDEGGYSLGLRTDVDQVAKALVAYVNANGGIGGRKVEAVIRPTDPVSQEDQVAACTAMASDAKVFAVIGTAALIYAATQRCITVDNRIPMIHSYALSHDFQAAAGGYDITSTPDLDRIAAEWASDAAQSGFVTPDSKVGIFTDACEPSNTVMKTTFQRQLAAAGVTNVTFAEVDCDPAAQQTQVPNAVLRLKSAGVDRAFLATSYIGVQNFLQNAQLQGWHPKYFTSTYDGLASNLFDKNFPKEQWDRTQAVFYGTMSTTEGGDERAPGFGRCADIVARAGLPAMQNDVANSEALAICEHFLDIFVPAATAVGPDLTRDGFVAAVQSLGSFTSALYNAASFRPGKVSAADEVADAEWHDECKCFVRTSPYRPAKF